jgi:glycogen operon protein
MVMDSLRYWVQDMHVDGFRFDLAPVLGRGDHGFERGGLLQGHCAGPGAAGRVKLIAEPWDVGPGGYQVGQFSQWLARVERPLPRRPRAPSGWAATARAANSRIAPVRARPTCSRRRQRSPLEFGQLRRVARRLHAADLVSYDMRHNEANREDNRDGHGHNLSWNCGWSKARPRTRPSRRFARGCSARCWPRAAGPGHADAGAGDELGHSQGGNNNPYCQDNEITWIDWEHGRHGTDCLHLASALVTTITQRLVGGYQMVLAVADQVGRGPWP